MKKLLLGFALLLLLVSGGAYYLYANLDAIVERAIEDAGTAATGSAVKVDGVAIDLAAGSATVRGFTLANPAGFSERTLLGFDELAVVLDLASLSRSHVGIHSIQARSPRVLYETRDGRSNLDVLAERLRGEPAPVDAEATAEVQLDIAAIDIEAIGATLDSDRLPAPVNVELGDIGLRDLEGTPTEIAQAIMRPLVAQLSRNAAAALLSATADRFGETAQALGAELLDSAGEGAEAVGGAIREGFGALFGRGDEDEATAESSP